MSEAIERSLDPRPRAHRPEYFLLAATVSISALELVAYATGALGAHAATLRALIGLSPWFVLSAVFVLLYRGPAMELGPRFARWLDPWVTHALFVAIVALTVGALLRWTHTLAGVELAPWPSFLAECVAMSWIVVLPSYALERARRREREVLARLEQAERSALDAQLRALQAQTNPHFLFNSLNVVAGLIHEDPTLAERTLERFSSLFRYSIEGARESVVRLERELSFIEDYLEVQRLRFGARLDVVIESDPRAWGAEVPPLLLQPLVENAVLHGLSAGGAVRVRVRVAREASGVALTVEDDGPGLGASAHRGTQSSLAALRKRIEATEGASFWLRDRAGGGCVATVFLPVKSP